MSINTLHKGDDDDDNNNITIAVVMVQEYKKRVGLVISSVGCAVPSLIVGYEMLSVSRFSTKDTSLLL